MRKAFLLGGVALLVAAVSLAGQRTRGSGPALRGDAGEPAPAFTEDLNADGSVVLADVIAEYGSVERFLTEMGMNSQPSTVAADGERMNADGSVAHFADLIGSNGPEIWTLEAHQQAVPWMESGSDDDYMIVFADGLVVAETGQAGPGLSDRTGLPSTVVGSETLWADGVVKLE